MLDSFLAPSFTLAFSPASACLKVHQKLANSIEAWIDKMRTLSWIKTQFSLSNKIS